MNHYTISSLMEEINNYFNGFFSKIYFTNNEYGLQMKAQRKGLEIEYFFDLDTINSIAYSFHHILEDIKGGFVRHESIILLEHQKN